MRLTLGRLELLASLLGSGLVLEPLLAAVCKQQLVVARVLVWLQHPSLTDWLLVAVGAGQILLLYKQSRISVRQIETVERLERPLLLPVTELGFVGYRQRGNKSTFPVVSIDFENYGRSPALVDCWHVATVVSIDEPKRRVLFDKFFMTFTQGTSWEAVRDGVKTIYTGTNTVSYKRIVSTRPSVAPSDRLGSVDLDEVSLNPQQISDIAEGVQTIWMDGVLYYYDVWNTKRETHFRWKYDYHLDLFIKDEDPTANRYT